MNERTNVESWLNWEMNSKMINAIVRLYDCLKKKSISKKKNYRTIVLGHHIVYYSILTATVFVSSILERRHCIISNLFRPLTKFQKSYNRTIACSMCTSTKQDKWSVSLMSCQTKSTHWRSYLTSTMGGGREWEEVVIQIMNNDTFVFDCLQAFACICQINCPQVLEWCSSSHDEKDMNGQL